MRIKWIVPAVSATAMVAFTGFSAAAEDTADRVLTNARIYTVDDKTSWAEAVAVKGNRIVYVGDNAGAEAYVGETTIKNDLGGKFVMPGIIDGHTHPGMMGLVTFDGWLPHDVAKHEAKEKILAAVQAYAKANPGSGWIKMCCWHGENFLDGEQPGPHKRDLDAIVSDRPVWLAGTATHGAWLNSKALEVIGVTKDTPDPAPGVAEYVRDKNGELTGWLKEGAGWQFTAKHFDPQIEAIKKGIDVSLHTLSSHGVTTVFDAGNLDYHDEVYGYLAELEAAGKLPMRYEGTYMVYLPERRHKAVKEMKRLRAAYGGERLKFRTIKLFMDGITPELASGYIEPFQGHPNEKGGTTLSTADLRDWLLELHDEKFDLHIHTIGDLAVRRVLDAVEAAKAVVGKDFYPRVTVAHLEIIDPIDWARFGELGVTANHTAFWHGKAAEDQTDTLIGAKRGAYVYPVKQLIEAGGNVAFSSDTWSVRSFSPFLGIQVGHNRHYPDEWIQAKGEDPDEFRPVESERVALDDMIRGYTSRGAYPFRMENEIGSIEVGKSADLLVLDSNPFEIKSTIIHKIKPAVVMLEGQVLHGDLN